MRELKFTFGDNMMLYFGDWSGDLGNNLRLKGASPRGQHLRRLFVEYGIPAVLVREAYTSKRFHAQTQTQYDTMYGITNTPMKAAQLGNVKMKQDTRIRGLRQRMAQMQHRMAQGYVDEAAGAAIVQRIRETLDNSQRKRDASVGSASRTRYSYRTLRWIVGGKSYVRHRDVQAALNIAAIGVYQQRSLESGGPGTGTPPYLRPSP